MKLTRVHIIKTETCGGLLDDLDIELHNPILTNYNNFDPICFIGPNGSGKSQFLQIITEIFQDIYHEIVPSQERDDGKNNIQYEVEYLIKPEGSKQINHVRISRQSVNNQQAILKIEKKEKDNWLRCDPIDSQTISLLPQKIIGYTSGENETLSLPFLISRSGYADEVAKIAFSENSNYKIPETKLMLIDYETNLEVLVSNLLTINGKQLKELLDDVNLKDLHSFRCVIQLAHSAAPKVSSNKNNPRNRKGIQLTEELEKYLEKLQKCSTCFYYDPKDERYIFDFWVNDEVKKAFRNHWKSTLDLYTSLHKLSMLNDLTIPRNTRTRFKRETKQRHFATKLPEPQDEDKAFRFDQVRFYSKREENVVDYVSLSDGEHQFVQLLGIFSMLCYSNILFILDEPDSHLNPLWRTKFISRIIDLTTQNGKRKSLSNSDSAKQDCLLSTHAPFIPSDMGREKVFIFKKEGGKVRVTHPDVETYGTTFDTILEQCFEIRPPISGVSNKDIENLMKSNNPEEIRLGMDRLGHSVEKVFLADRLKQLTK